MTKQYDYDVSNAIDPAKEALKKLRVKAQFLLIDDHDSIVVYPADEDLDYSRLKTLLAAHTVQLLNDTESEWRFSTFKEKGISYLENEYHFRVYCTDRIIEYDTLCFLQAVGENYFLCSTDEFIRALKPIVGTFSKINR